MARRADRETYCLGGGRGDREYLTEADMLLFKWWYIDISQGHTFMSVINGAYSVYFLEQEQELPRLTYHNCYNSLKLPCHCSPDLKRSLK